MVALRRCFPQSQCPTLEKIRVFHRREPNHPVSRDGDQRRDDETFGQLQRHESDHSQTEPMGDRHPAPGGRPRHRLIKRRILQGSEPPIELIGEFLCVRQDHRKYDNACRHAKTGAAGGDHEHRRDDREGDNDIAHVALKERQEIAEAFFGLGKLLRMSGHRINKRSRVSTISGTPPTLATRVGPAL